MVIFVVMVPFMFTVVVVTVMNPDMCPAPGGGQPEESKDYYNGDHHRKAARAVTAVTMIRFVVRFCNLGILHRRRMSPGPSRAPFQAGMMADVDEKS